MLVVVLLLLLLILLLLVQLSSRFDFNTTATAAAAAAAILTAVNNDVWPVHHSGLQEIAGICFSWCLGVDLWKSLGRHLTPTARLFCCNWGSANTLSLPCWLACRLLLLLLPSAPPNGHVLPRCVYDCSSLLLLLMLLLLLRWLLRLCRQQLWHLLSVPLARLLQFAGSCTCIRGCCPLQACLLLQHQTLPWLLHTCRLPLALLRLVASCSCYCCHIYTQCPTPLLGITNSSRSSTTCHHTTCCSSCTVLLGCS